MTIFAVLLFLITFVIVSIPCSLKWRAEDTRKRLQKAYDLRQVQLAQRCEGEHQRLIDGDLLMGLYGSYPPALEFRPPETRPTKPKALPAAYAPVVRCAKHDLAYVSDTKCIQCLGENSYRAVAKRSAQCPCECGIGKMCHACAPVKIGNSEYWMEKRRQATPCLSCGKAVPASGSRLCAECDVPARVPGSATDAEVLACFAAVPSHDIVVPIVWDEKSQAVMPDVSRVVHDFGGAANCLYPSP